MRSTTSTLLAKSVQRSNYAPEPRQSHKAIIPSKYMTPYLLRIQRAAKAIANNGWLDLNKLAERLAMNPNQVRCARFRIRTLCGSSGWPWKSIRMAYTLREGSGGDKSKTLTPTQRLTLDKLGEHADDDGFYCTRQVADDLGITENALDRRAMRLRALLRDRFNFSPKRQVSPTSTEDEQAGVERRKQEIRQKEQPTNVFETPTQTAQDVCSGYHQEWRKKVTPARTVEDYKAIQDVHHGGRKPMRYGLSAKPPGWFPPRDKPGCAEAS